MANRDASVSSETYPIDVEARFQDVRSKMEDMAGRDDVGRWRAPDGFMAHAIYEASERLGAPGFEWLDNLFKEGIARHPSRSAVNWANLWPRLFNNFMLRTGGITYDRAITSLPYLDALKHDPDEQEALHRNADLNVRTNVPDRSSLLKLIAVLRGPEAPLHILDIGGGEGHNAKKLLYHSQPQGSFPYRHIDLFDPLPGDTGQLDYNPMDSQIVNSITQAWHLPIGSVVGIDLHPPLMGQQNPDADWQRLWDISCFYTSEHLRDPERIAEYGYWENRQFDNHLFHQADVTELDIEKVRKVQPGVETYDIAYLSFSGYQLGDDGLQAARDKLEPLLVSEDGNRKGCIVLTDVADVDEAGELRFSNDWQLWRYGTFLYDFADDKPEWQPLIKTKTGRIGRAVLMPEFAKLPLAHEFGLRSNRSLVTSKAAN